MKDWPKMIRDVGIVGFALLYVLGAIPGLPSPITKIAELLAAHAAESREDRRTFRVMCHALTKDDPTLRLLCGSLHGRESVE